MSNINYGLYSNLLFFARFISRLRISIDFYSSLNDANLCLSLNTERNGQQTLQIISLKKTTHIVRQVVEHNKIMIIYTKISPTCAHRESKGNKLRPRKKLRQFGAKNKQQILKRKLTVNN